MTGPPFRLARGSVGCGDSPWQGPGEAPRIAFDRKSSPPWLKPGGDGAGWGVPGWVRRSARGAAFLGILDGIAVLLLTAGAPLVPPPDLVTPAPHRFLQRYYLNLLIA